MINFFELGKQAASKQAGVPWGAIGRGAADVGKGLFNYGVPVGAGALTAREMYDKGYPVSTAATEGLAAGLLTSPKLWSHYKSMGLKDLAAKGVTNPNAVAIADSALGAAKVPLVGKLLLAAGGMTPMLSNTAKNVSDITAQAAEASKDLPKITGRVDKGVGDVIKDIKSTTAWGPSIAAGVGQTTALGPTIAGNIAKSTDISGINKEIEGAASNLKEVLGGAGKAGKELTPGIKEFIQSLGSSGAGLSQLVEALQGEGAQNFGRLAKSQADINEMITKYGPPTAAAGLGVGGIYALTNLYKSMKERQAAKQTGKRRRPVTA